MTRLEAAHMRRASRRTRPQGMKHWFPTHASVAAPVRAARSVGRAISGSFAALAAILAGVRRRETVLLIPRRHQGR